MYCVGSRSEFRVQISDFRFQMLDLKRAGAPSRLGLSGCGEGRCSSATWDGASIRIRRIMELADGVIKPRTPPLPRPHARLGWAAQRRGVPRVATERPAAKAEQHHTSHHQPKNCAFLPHGSRSGGREQGTRHIRPTRSLTSTYCLSPCALLEGEGGRWGRDKTRHTIKSGATSTIKSN